MKNYKLILKFSNSMVFNTLPILDGVLSYGIFKRLNGDKYIINIPGRIQDIPNNMTNLINIELNKCIEHINNSIMLCSMFIPSHKPIEHTEFWYKRFDTEYIRFLKRTKNNKINVGSGYFKSFKVPVFANCINEGHFIFKGDGEKVKSIFEEHILGLGKKISIGYGWIEKIKLEELEELKNIDILIKRPIPLEYALDLKIKGRIMNVAYKYPYWDIDNITKCIVPDNY